VVGQGSKPTHVHFVIEGDFAVAVRDSSGGAGGGSSGSSGGGSSALKDMARLGPGDTFGEVALLGVPRQPAFVVARGERGSTLAVDAARLAAAMVDELRSGAGAAC
jgi:CRP-like cAMP-binding protein